MPGFSYQVSAIRFQLSGFSYQVSAIRFQLSGFSYQVSANILKHLSCIFLMDDQLAFKHYIFIRDRTFGRSGIKQFEQELSGAHSLLIGELLY